MENANGAGEAKKDWIKNCIIIFLVIMLILTFFSNTIMNLSVPEVTTAYIQSGAIQEIVRGTGNVEAADPYKVLAQENRKIASVAVKEGDHVEQGDVIFALEDAESKELQELQDEIDRAELDYYLSLLSGEMTGEAAARVSKSGVGSFSDNISQIRTYDDAIAAAEASIQVAQANIEGRNNQAASASAASAAAEVDKAAAENEKQLLQERFEKEKAVKTAEYTNKIAELQGKIDEIKNAIQSSTDINTGDIVNAIKALNGNNGTGTPIIAGAFDITVSSEADSETLKSVYNLIKSKATDEEKASESYTNAVAEVDQAFTNYYNSMGSAKSLESLGAELDKYNALKTANEASSFADSSGYQEALNKIENANNTIQESGAAKADIEAALKGDEGALKRAQEYLEKLKNDRNQLISNLKGGYNADAAGKKIQSMKDRLEKMKEAAYGATITAPMTGTVKNLVLVAGESTIQDQEMFTIIPDGKGLVLRINVTNEQARRIKVGDMAELPWGFEGGECIVTSISPSPDGMGKEQIVTFKLSLDDETSGMMLGQSLSVSLGAAARDFDLIVPKAAVRSDNSGDYVLVVKARTSPLGNRYSASKVSVTRQAADDNSIAISGDLNPYDYVVIQSTKPVSDGQQIKLSSGEAE